MLLIQLEVPRAKPGMQCMLSEHLLNALGFLLNSQWPSSHSGELRTGHGLQVPWIPMFASVPGSVARPVSGLMATLLHGREQQLPPAVDRLRDRVRATGNAGSLSLRGADISTCYSE